MTEAGTGPSPSLTDGFGPGLDRLRHLVREVSVELISERVARVTIREWLSAPETTFGFASRQEYTIYGSGDVVVDVYL